MKNYYEIIRNVRRKMRLEEQISPDDIIDYYWSLHRLHEDKAELHQEQVLLSESEKIEGHRASRDRHHVKAREYKIMAEEFEEKAYPGLSKCVGEIRSDENKDEKS